MGRKQKIVERAGLRLQGTIRSGFRVVDPSTEHENVDGETLCTPFFVGLIRQVRAGNSVSFRYWTADSGPTDESEAKTIEQATDSMAEHWQKTLRYRQWSEQGWCPRCDWDL